MTAILGISAFYHDSAAALLIDGEIVAAAQEERFSREKHDSSFPERAIQYCLDEARIEPMVGRQARDVYRVVRDQRAVEGTPVDPERGGRHDREAGEKNARAGSSPPRRHGPRQRISRRWRV